MNGGGGDAMKRAAEASDDERAAKQVKTEAPAGAMAAMFGAQPGAGLFFMGSQPMLSQAVPLPAQPMLAMAPSVPTTQEQHMQMQMQQRQQQQFAAAMAARRNAQQQQQAATMAMMGQQSAAPTTQQMQTNPHVASLMGTQGVSYQTAATQMQQCAAPTGMQDLLKQEPPQQQTAMPAIAPQVPVTPVVPVTSNETEEPCLVCGKKGDIFTCNGGCGLHVHPACIGEDAIFPFVGRHFVFVIHAMLWFGLLMLGLLKLNSRSALRKLLYCATKSSISGRFDKGRTKCTIGKISILTTWWHTLR
ncbi:unnamed protein product [Phytophthora lilii]|uniref:Unnamed protein product n=1 Tax=Phytophthora lilii TaxID=2077276 RepID=A0A9W6THJ2_9STRA|nr:unnamed protein product [Phytophthora lilii]